MNAPRPQNEDREPGEPMLDAQESTFERDFNDVSNDEPDGFDAFEFE